MAKRVLTASEMEQANAYAKSHWPDENVSVERKTDESGKIRVKRVKMSVIELPKEWKPPK